MAVEMAELCPSRAVHAEVIEMCNSVVATQQQEITKMKSWLSDWYGITYEPQMTPHEMRDVESMAGTSGEDFEKHFLLSMTPHHMVAIENAGECLAEGLPPPTYRRVQDHRDQPSFRSGDDARLVGEVVWHPGPQLHALAT